MRFGRQCLGALRVGLERGEVGEDDLEHGDDAAGLVLLTLIGGPEGLHVFRVAQINLALVIGVCHRFPLLATHLDTRALSPLRARDLLDLKESGCGGRLSVELLEDGHGCLQGLRGTRRVLDRCIVLGLLGRPHFGCFLHRGIEFRDLLSQRSHILGQHRDRGLSLRNFGAQFVDGFGQLCASDFAYSELLVAKTLVIRVGLALLEQPADQILDEFLHLAEGVGRDALGEQVQGLAVQANGLLLQELANGGAGTLGVLRRAPEGLHEAFRLHLRLRCRQSEVGGSCCLHVLARKDFDGLLESLNLLLSESLLLFERLLLLLALHSNVLESLGILSLQGLRGSELLLGSGRLLLLRVLQHRLRRDSIIRSSGGVREVLGKHVVGVLGIHLLFLAIPLLFDKFGLQLLQHLDNSSRLKFVGVCLWSVFHGWFVHHTQESRHHALSGPRELLGLCKLEQSTAIVVLLGEDCYSALQGINALAVIRLLC
mmetsp:Transcript_92260/g.192945  ORF Transcript_92260/g.192945 Transcript_92260/m.192945 type:complete len:485 (+) Transcript_92260:571-2025(+)